MTDKKKRRPIVFNPPRSKPLKRMRLRFLRAYTVREYLLLLNPKIEISPAFLQTLDDLVSMTLDSAAESNQTLDANAALTAFKYR